MTQANRSVKPAVIVQLLFFIILIPLLPLLISGRWSWWEAWAYAAVAILGFAISRAWLGEAIRGCSAGHRLVGRHR